ncbi:MAG: 3,4-dihydroxy-2-butanone-4-phosphate synthase [Burkholderiales bacterium]|jgi:3,4-dihydroxy 2-butanone 4-phosphate synthase/GTP cyclohydrolase II|nr:3,4-dihydroxy-2-butanone-4-phosphate synthase [Burkholderiales bacterium]
MAIAPIPEVLAELRAGRMIVLVDEENRENEGDLMLAAEFVTPEAINFMATHARGLVCLTLTSERCQQLKLPLMTPTNRSSLGTNFTLSIEAAEGVTTGISAADRARTIQAAVAPDARPEDLVQPGHIFPLMAQPGGVLVRAGHTEAGCDLARMAGLMPSTVICEVLKEDGAMARLPDLEIFAEKHGLKIGTIADLIHHRSQNETLLERMAQRPLQTTVGAFELFIYRDKLTDATHLALVHGTPIPEQETLVRVHEPISIMDLLDVQSESHAWGVFPALRELKAASAGVMVFLHRPESAQDLRYRAAAEKRNADVSMALRDYGIGAQILRDLNVQKMRLLARPRKMPSMAGFGLEVTGFQEQGLLNAPS